MNPFGTHPEYFSPFIRAPIVDPNRQDFPPGGRPSPFRSIHPSPIYDGLQFTSLGPSPHSHFGRRASYSEYPPSFRFAPVNRMMPPPVLPLPDFGLYQWMFPDSREGFNFGIGTSTGMGMSMGVGVSGQMDNEENSPMSPWEHIGRSGDDRDGKESEKGYVETIFEVEELDEGAHGKNDDNSGGTHDDTAPSSNELPSDKDNNLHGHSSPHILGNPSFDFHTPVPPKKEKPKTITAARWQAVFAREARILARESALQKQEEQLLRVQEDVRESQRELQRAQKKLTRDRNELNIRESHLQQLAVDLEGKREEIERLGELGIESARREVAFRPGRSGGRLWGPNALVGLGTELEHGEMEWDDEIGSLEMWTELGRDEIR